MEGFEEISEAADEGGDAAPTGGKGTRPTRSRVSYLQQPFTFQYLQNNDNSLRLCGLR